MGLLEMVNLGWDQCTATIRIENMCSPAQCSTKVTHKKLLSPQSFFFCVCMPVNLLVHQSLVWLCVCASRMSRPQTSVVTCCPRSPAFSPVSEPTQNSMLNVTLTWFPPEQWFPHYPTSYSELPHTHTRSRLSQLSLALLSSPLVHWSLLSCMSNSDLFLWSEGGPRLTRID